MFHSFLSDNSKQDAAITAEHSKLIIELLGKIKCVGAGEITIWDNTDACAEYYRRATAL